MVLKVVSMVEDMVSMREVTVASRCNSSFHILYPGVVLHNSSLHIGCIRMARHLSVKQGSCMQSLNTMETNSLNPYIVQVDSKKDYRRDLYSIKHTSTDNVAFIFMIWSGLS